MENRNSGAVKGGVSFLGLLQIAFIVLKLTKVIDWSWWCVLIPLWIDIGVIVIALLVVFLAILKGWH